MQFPHVDPSEEADAQRLLITAFETVPVGDGLAGRAALGGDPVRSLRQRARRARRKRALIPAGALLAAGGVSLAIAMTAAATAPVPAISSAGSMSSVRAILMAAVERTSAQSYTFTTVNQSKQGGNLGQAEPSVKITGIFDPATLTGEESLSLFGPGRYGNSAAPNNMSVGFGSGLPMTEQPSTLGGGPVTAEVELTPPPGVATNIIFADGHTYADLGHKAIVYYARCPCSLPPGTPDPAGNTSGKSWLEGVLPYTVEPSSWDGYGYDDNEPIAPSALLGLIKSAASLTNEGPASGPGWTGTKYGFTVHHTTVEKYTSYGQNSQGTQVSRSGVMVIHAAATYTIDVDSQGLVRSVASTSAEVFKSHFTSKLPPNCPPDTCDLSGRGPTGRAVVTNQTSYGGFGTPVSVTPPNPSETYQYPQPVIVNTIVY